MDWSHIPASADQPARAPNLAVSTPQQLSVPSRHYASAFGQRQLAQMSGSRFRFLAFPLFAFLLLVGIFGLLFALHREPELSYQGKPLTYWFNQLPMTTTGPNGAVVPYSSTRLSMRAPSGAVMKYGNWIEPAETLAPAIRGIGTNAINFYLGKLTRQYGPLKRTIFRAARALHYRGFLFHDIYPEREQAATALILLQPLPPAAVSELLTLSTNRDQQIAAAAHAVLTLKQSDLIPLHHPATKYSLDFNGPLNLDLLNLPDLSNAK